MTLSLTQSLHINLNLFDCMEQLAVNGFVFVDRLMNTKRAHLFEILTLSEATSKTAPIGTNIIPTMKKTGSAVEAVKIGCHAFNRCCLNGVSEKNFP